jgi:hypothetical protein
VPDTNKRPKGIGKFLCPNIIKTMIRVNLLFVIPASVPNAKPNWFAERLLITGLHQGNCSVSLVVMQVTGASLNPCRMKRFTTHGTKRRRAIFAFFFVNPFFRFAID